MVRRLPFQNHKQSEIRLKRRTDHFTCTEGEVVCSFLNFNPESCRKRVKNSDGAKKE